MKKRMMKKVDRGFTLIELLTVIAIISLLLGLALPALNEARFHAREIGDKASLTSIGNAVETFNNEIGYYPNSSPRDALELAGGSDGSLIQDQGAHRLFEALAGLDYLGFQKNNYYDVSGQGEPIDPMGLTMRYGPFLKLESLKIETMQICHPESDNFDASENDNPVFVSTVDPGLPRAILYYRARRSGHLINTIYDYFDNAMITQDESGGTPIHSELDQDIANEFERFIWNPKTGLDPMNPNNPPDISMPNARPYNKESFLLINAGRDGEYGTQDDITNYLK